MPGISEPREPSPTAMRSVLGNFPSGVVVVTAAGADGPVGFTCQSFASLSLQPALISFAVARTSTTWPQIREIGTFCVNVLSKDHEHHSGGFARSGTDKFQGVVWTRAPSGAPIIDGVCAWTDCTLSAVHDAGDHEIVVGEVRALAGDPSRTPLLFHQGGYGLAERDVEL